MFCTPVFTQAAPAASNSMIDLLCHKLKLGTKCAFFLILWMSGSQCHGSGDCVETIVTSAVEPVSSIPSASHSINDMCDPFKKVILLPVLWPFMSIFFKVLLTSCLHSSISRKTSRLSLAEMGPISGERVSVQNNWECPIHLTNSFT